MANKASTSSRPPLTNKLDADIFKNFYWYKKELIEFCKAYNISSYGGKIDIINRIEIYLRTGKKSRIIKQNEPSVLDSDRPITRKTRVINYKNDAKTRDFFMSEIGSSFHFNTYLRNFAKSNNKNLNLTYGDLVDGYLKEEEEKKKPGYKTKIAPQFQYNQFQRDFYASEKGKTRQEFNAAWKLVRSVPGEATYEHYKQLKKEENKPIKRKSESIDESKSKKRK